MQYLFHLSNKITGTLLNSESSIVVEEKLIVTYDFFKLLSILSVEKVKFLNVWTSHFLNNDN